MAQALATIAAMLEAAGIPEPRREARLILTHALGCKSSGLLTHDEVPESTGMTFAARRARHEPLAYITGHREFWSLDLAVSPATLIPRADSETLIDAALHHIKDRASVTSILDLGTGTGALLLAALTECPAAFGIGVDRVAAAAVLARTNAHRLNLAHRSAFIVGDWAEALTATFDLILANPPYIPTTDIVTLMPEVAGFEPASALDGGPDGFVAYRHIIANLPRLLAPGGIAIVEAGIGQAGGISALAEAHGLTSWGHADLTGLPRAIVMTALGSRTQKTTW
ncbi:MAG: peptide chain release factor N(5)-glutamine methyltransferase [Acidiphilium sp.]|nr:peptide chain release factor N(5)-glutamine methyltransferase [Acidiphilium sp.]